MTRPPGSALPAVAQLAMFLAAPVRFIERARRAHGDIFTVRSPIFGNEIIITRPETIRALFRGDPERVRAGEANRALAPLVGPASVLLLDGSAHRRQRQLLLPPFHGDRMRAYTDVMREQTLRVLSRWRDGEVVTVQPAMQRITLEVILRTVFGMDEDRSLEELRGALEVMLVGPTSTIGMLPLIPVLQRDLGPLWPYGRFLRQLEKTDAMIHRQIRRARARGQGGDDILSLLLAARDDDGQPMTDDELRDELVTLLVAGHETTATSLSWAFEQLLLHREVHDRIMAELREVVGDGPVDATHLGNLRYLDAAIKETLRVRPIIPFFGRKLAQPTDVQGYDIPAGDMVVPCSWLVHRDPELYPEPERFRPERFLDAKPDPYAWIPFGGGGRRCIGMAFALYEMKVVLATALTARSLRLASPRAAPVALRGFAFSPRGGTRVIAAAPRKASRHATDAARAGA